MRFRALLAGAALAAAPFAASLAPALGQAFQPRIPSIDELPDLPGRETVFYTCTACHGLDVIKAQRLGHDRWNEIVTEMVVVNGLAEPTPDERRTIVDYLAAAFPEGPATPGAAYTNPFLPR